MALPNPSSLSLLTESVENVGIKTEVAISPQWPNLFLISEAEDFRPVPTSLLCLLPCSSCTAQLPLVVILKKKNLRTISFFIS